MTLTRATLLALLLLFAGCAQTGDDDDAANDDDAADDDDSVCGEASGGSGGALDSLVWFDQEGNVVTGEGSAEYHTLVYSPSSAAVTPTPVLFLVGRRMPTVRSENEDIFEGLGMLDWAEDYGWTTMLANPGDTGGGQINWTGSNTDDAFFHDALDVVAAHYDIDLDRVHAAGSSAGGRAASFLGYTHGDRLASIANHAGNNPFSPWPETPWENECAGFFIHGLTDNVVPRAAVEDVRDMFADAGQVTGTHFDYEYGHEWRPEGFFPEMKAFFDSVCNE